MGSEGFFLVWIMGDGISEHSSACHKKELLDIMGSHNARNMNVMGSWLFIYLFLNIP